MKPTIQGAHLDVAVALVGALRRMMRVAQVDEMGELHPMSQATLSELSGVSISSVRKYLRREAGVHINPSLENLCRMADVLKVPPAFLLMRPEDWTRLASAVEWWPKLANDESYIGFAQGGERPGGSSPVDCVDGAFELARLMGLHGPPVRPLGAGNPMGLHASGLPTNSVAPPYAQIDDGWHPVLQALCTVIGASIQERSPHE